MLDQDDVIRLQFVRAALHHVGDMTFDEYGDLVEIVIVVLNFPCLLVCQVEQTELALQISFFLITLHNAALRIDL